MANVSSHLDQDLTKAEQVLVNAVLRSEPFDFADLAGRIILASVLRGLILADIISHCSTRRNGVAEGCSFSLVCFSGFGLHDVPVN